MAWMRPSRSKLGQGRWESINSGGAASSWRAGPSGSGMDLEADAGKGARSGSRCGSLFSSATIPAVCLERFDLAGCEHLLTLAIQARTLDWLAEEALANPVSGWCRERWRSAGGVARTALSC